MRATLVFYPSARPLRALIKEIASPAQENNTEVSFGDGDLLQAYSEYEEALAAIPWVQVWPLKFADARVRRNGERLFLCPAQNNDLALPLISSQADAASPLLAIESFSGFGLWDGYACRLCMAQTPLGRWVSE